MGIFCLFFHLQRCDLTGPAPTQIQVTVKEGVDLENISLKVAAERKNIMDVLIVTLIFRMIVGLDDVGLTFSKDLQFDHPESYRLFLRSPWSYSIESKKDILKNQWK